MKLKDNEYLEAKMIKFTETVKHWLSGLGHPYVYPNTESPDDQGVADICNPDDSTSNYAETK